MTLEKIHERYQSMNDYQFCPLCGTALGEIVEEGHTLKHCHGCKKFTHYDNPKGVAVAVIPKDGGLVLIKRLINPRAGKFALPGGFINKGEGPRQAVVRETLEETGLVVEVVRALDELPVPVPNQFLCFYLVKVVGGELKAGSDAGEVAVHKLDALPADIAFPLHDQVIKAWIAGGAKAE
jgi:mutator protein MutT